MLELAKEMECEKKQIVVGYRDAQTFLREEFEAERRSLYCNRRRKCRNKGQCYGCNPGKQLWKQI